MYSNTKAQHIAAGLLSLTPSHRLSKLALMKLMYIADRVSVERHGYVMSNAEHFSLKHGPILSEALDAVNGTAGELEPWAPMISRDGDELYLTSPVSLDDLDELSDAEVSIISEVASTFDGYTPSQLRNLTHDFPEWKDPGSSRIPITFTDIALAVGLSVEEAQALEEQRLIEKQLERMLVSG